MDYNSKITEYGLSVRTLNVLKAHGVETIGEACMLTYDKILTWKYAGKRTALEICDMRENMIRLCGDAPLREIEYRKTAREYAEAVKIVKKWAKNWPATLIYDSDVVKAVKLIIKVKEL